VCQLVLGSLLLFGVARHVSRLNNGHGVRCSTSLYRQDAVARLSKNSHSCVDVLENYRYNYGQTLTLLLSLKCAA
jgi:hypothetical protein